MAHRSDEDGRLNRGACTGDVRQILDGRTVDMADKRASDVYLNQEQTKQLLSDLAEKAQKAPSHEKRLAKVYSRGFALITCRCPMYHTVDLGQVKLFTPGNQ
jgi:uncharacterized protein YfcZ (UPF0381/DUF406 family)